MTRPLLTAEHPSAQTLLHRRRNVAESATASAEAEDDGLNAARAIRNGILISLPVWAIAVWCAWEIAVAKGWIS